MKLKNYCEKKGISMAKFAALCDISTSQVYYIDRQAQPQVTFDVIDRIYNKTKKKYGVGLRPHEYLPLNKEIFGN